MIILIGIIVAILILGLLIVFHETGHYMAAKLVNIKVHEFSIGMGPKIFNVQKGETEYTLRVLPIGGYVKMEGEDESSEDERAFGNRPLWARIIVVAAGAVMNFILAFIIFIIILSSMPAIPQPIVGELMEGMPAQEAGLLPGDKVVQLNDYKVYIQKDISYFLDRNKGEAIDAIIEREGKRVHYTITPRFNEEYGRYMLGYNVKNIKPTILTVLTNSYYETAFLTKAILVSFGDLITGKVGFGQVSGPVGIVGEIGNAAKAGFEYLLFLAALISINLGIFNLLPIPALDGSRIMFLLLEGVRGKPINPEREGMVHMVGFVLLLLLMVMVTFNDLARIFG